MPTLPPLDPVDSLTALASPIFASMQTRGISFSLTSPAAWVLDLLQQRNAGALTLPTACTVARHIIANGGTSTDSHRFAALAALESLGRVNTTPLTLDCLTKLIEHARLLHFTVTTGNIQTRAQLSTATASRKTSTKSTCIESLPFLAWLDRIAAALAPLLSR